MKALERMDRCDRCGLIVDDEGSPPKLYTCTECGATLCFQQLVTIIGRDQHGAEGREMLHPLLRRWPGETENRMCGPVVQQKPETLREIVDEISKIATI